LTRPTRFPRTDVLLVGDARMAFPVAKALDRAGARVFAGVSVSSNYLEWSRHVTASFRHSPLEPGTDEALPVILNWIDRRGGIDAIQPVSEAGSRLMSRHRRAFQARGRLIMPDADTVAACMDKTGLFRLCEQLGVALAPFRRVRTLAEARAAARTLGFPVIVKPSVVDAELFGRKALIVADEPRLATLMPHWPEIHPELIVQRYVTGPRHSVIFTADRGRLLGAVEIRAARTHEHDGTGYTTYGVTVAPTPRVREGVERLVRALDYSSTGCAQFVVDPRSGDLTFMEINPRVSLARIAEHAGLPHSVWGLELALGRRIAGWTDPWSARTGVRYVWTKGDLNLLMKRVADGSVGPLEAGRKLARIGLDAATCVHAIFDPLDPAPAIGVYANRWIKRYRDHPEYDPAWARTRFPEAFEATDALRDAA
jgi:predicted ATP-grasp superfamily ATP-dependent carboligase